MALNTNRSATLKRQTWVHGFAAVFFIAASIVAFDQIAIHNPVAGFQAAADKTLATSNCEGQPTLSVFTGIKGVDGFLKLLVSSFLAGISGVDKGFQLQQAYFLFGFFPLLVIYAIESGRKGNRWSFLTFPSIWAIGWQTVGGAIFIPLYYAAYIFTVARRRDYYAPESRTVLPIHAKALIPSALIGYIVPTILIYLPFWSPATLQKLLAFWQPCPIYVGLLLPVFSTLLSKPRSRSADADAKYLDILYKICITQSTVLHLVTVAISFTSKDSEASIRGIFDLTRRGGPGSAYVHGLKYIFQIDFWIIFGCSLLWAWLAAYELKLQNKTDVGLFRVFGGLVVGSVVLGPPATVAVAWYWREKVLMKAKVA